MRAYIPEYELKTPKNLDEIFTLMDDGYAPIAGGTDIMVLVAADVQSKKKFVNIQKIKELQGINEEKTHIEIGALTTFSEIYSNKTIDAEFLLLSKAARAVGALAIQNRGTIGGNIANASPAADAPPALLCYDAEITLISKSGERTLSYKDFHKDYKKMDLNSGELIKSIKLPRSIKTTSSYFRKVGARKAQAISKVVLAAIADKDNLINDVRIAIGSVAPTPLRCFKTESVLRGNKLDPALAGKALKTLEEEIAPIDDIRSNREYRRRVARNLLGEFLDTL